MTDHVDAAVYPKNVPDVGGKETLDAARCDEDNLSSNGRSATLAGMAASSAVGVAISRDGLAGLGLPDCFVEIDGAWTVLATFRLAQEGKAQEEAVNAIAPKPTTESQYLVKLTAHPHLVQFAR